MQKKLMIILGFSMIVAGGLPGQDIILDQPVRAGTLTLFPSLSNANEYYYLPDKPRLAVNERGQPQFSFFRYVQNQCSAPGQPDIREGEGGGIVHAVIALDVTEEQIAAATQVLRRLDPGGVISGPVLYQGGTIALISSAADPESGFSKRVIGLGKAPLLDGQQAAVSVQLTKVGAQVLWESFQTPTPDMSVSFEMELQGYKSPKKVTIEADFDQIYTYRDFETGIISRQGSTILGGEIEAAFDELYRSGAIKVTQIGEDEDLEAALEDAYKKLTKMMFEAETGNPMALGQVPAGGQSREKSILGRAQKLLEAGREDAAEDYKLLRESQRIEAFLAQREAEAPAASRSSTNEAQREPSRDRRPIDIRAPSEAYKNLPPHLELPPRAAEFDPPEMPTTAIVAVYRMREVRQRGVFQIDLNKYTVDNRAIRFDRNFGPLLNCDACFHQVNLDDPFFRQREIAAVLDGFNARDFGNYINYVNVSLVKEHGNGELTTDDILIDRYRFNESGNNFKLLYGWKNDEDSQQWRTFRYRVGWNFFGGYNLQTAWRTSRDNAIPLVPPLYIKSVDVEVDPEIMAREKVRSVEMNVYYQLGGKEQLKRIRLRTGTGELSKRIDLLQPPNKLVYEYEIIWYLRDGTVKRSHRKSGSSLVIFADQL